MKIKMKHLFLPPLEPYLSSKVSHDTKKGENDKKPKDPIQASSPLVKHVANPVDGGGACIFLGGLTKCSLPDCLQHPLIMFPVYTI